MGQWNVKLVLKDDKICTLSFQTEESARNFYDAGYYSYDLKSIELRYGNKFIKGTQIYM